MYIIELILRTESDVDISKINFGTPTTIMTETHTEIEELTDSIGGKHFIKKPVLEVVEP